MFVVLVYVGLPLWRETRGRIKQGRTWPALVPSFLPLGPLTALSSSGPQVAVENRKRPSILALSHQNMPNTPGGSIEGTAKGGYTIHEGAAKPDVILMGTGSEQQLAYDVASRFGPDIIRLLSCHAFLSGRQPWGGGFVLCNNCTQATALV